MKLDTRQLLVREHLASLQSLLVTTSVLLHQRPSILIDLSILASDMTYDLLTKLHVSRLVILQLLIY